jgi:hypothetical protein
LTNLGANRAVWIAKEPREEHIRAVEWLNEITPDDIAFYLIKLEAIRIGNHPVAAPQFTIVQGPSAEIKQIGAEKKEFARRHQVRLDFWTRFLEAMNANNSLCSNLSPTKDNWISIALGWSGVNVNCVISKTNARVEVYISRPVAEENKRIFDGFFAKREQIERDCGIELEWQRLNEKKASRIKCELHRVNYYTPEDWQRMIDFLRIHTEKLESVFRKESAELKARW